jgi:N4-(beta-N-acetylglucosaminyl)-L-asparaginase
MKKSRRTFLGLFPASLGATSLLTACAADAAADVPTGIKKPVVISTWQHGQAANTAAWEVLEGGGKALDAVEAGVRVTEADPKVRTVGRGAYPDRDGIITLDASIMGPSGDCGSVAAVEGILHPISLARIVMERTPHVMIVGQGAQDLAVTEGMEITDLSTEESRADYEKWQTENPGYLPPINVENHDTIGLLALDKNGDLAGACTTSGAAYKFHGRVGDSPIIGAGLYVDNAVGAATATGWGEAVIRACGCFLVVEFMRQGHSPEDACRLACERVIEKNPDWRDIQVGFIALDKSGRTGAYCIQPGFDYALQDQDTPNEMRKPPSRI